MPLMYIWNSIEIKFSLKKKMHIFTQELRTDTFFTWIPPPSTPKCQTVENAQT